MITAPTSTWKSRVCRLLGADRAVWVSRGIIAFVFLLYGGSKIMLPETLAISVRNYRLVPTELENIIGITLPWIEVIAAVALLSRKWLAGGLLVISGMLFAFLGAVGSALARGLDINCGCFTLTADSAAYNNLISTFFLDIFLLVLAAHIWWWLWSTRNSQAIDK